MKAYVGKVQRRQTTGTKEHVEEGDRENINGIVLRVQTPRGISDWRIMNERALLTWQ